MLQKLNDIRENKLKNNDSGFTIIEVMIVLAIAALILVVVFLAVPALQRSSRNNQRNTDASNILASVNTFVSNNNGTLPDDYSDDIADNTKTGFYEDGNVAITSYPSGGMDEATLGADASEQTDNLRVVTNAKCTDAQEIEEGDSSRSVAAFYAIEAGGGVQTKCLEG